jgi:hypothetical protein
VPLRLERALKREVDIGGVTHTVTVSALGVRLVRKGFRKGVAVSWRRLLALAAGDLAAGDLAADHRAGDRAGARAGDPGAAETVDAGRTAAGDPAGPASRRGDRPAG